MKAEVKGNRIYLNGKCMTRETLLTMARELNPAITIEAKKTDTRHIVALYNGAIRGGFNA